MAGFAASMGSREFGFDGATTALLTLAAVVAADAAGRALADRGIAGIVLALLTILGTASVASLGVMALTDSGASGARTDGSIVKRDPVRPPPHRGMHGGRVLWIGFDDPWGLAELPPSALADRPRLNALVANGAAVALDCLDLTGAAAWTTAATGRLPGEHGIRGETFLGASFLPPIPLDIRAPSIAGFLGALRLTTRCAYTSNQRRTKAIWNMADDAHLTCRVLAFPITYPAERLRGEILSPLAVDVDEALDDPHAGYAEPAEFLAATRALAATIDGGAPAGWRARNRLVRDLALRRDAPSSERIDLTIAHLTFPDGDASLRAGALAQLDEILTDVMESLGPLDTLVVTGVPSSARAGAPGFLHLFGSAAWRERTHAAAARLLDVCPLLLHGLGLPMAADLPFEDALAILGLTVKPHVIPTWEAPNDGGPGASAGPMHR
jgi:hypothetical protein